MKIYLVHSSKYNFREELYKPLQNSDLNKKHEIVYLYDQTDKPGSTKDLIKSCDLVVAEVSFSSMGVGIELGWASAFNVPIICAHKPGQIGSQFLNIITKHIFEYSDNHSLISHLDTLVKIYSND